MPPLYRIIEVSVYSLLNFLPLLALALYPFRNSLRFSKKITAVLIGLVTVVQLILGACAAILPNSKAGMISAVSTVLYTAFYFLAVKKHIGKTLFTILMISNIANLTVVSSKCLEGFFFPELAVQSYRWSFSLMLFAVEAVLAVPIFLYMKKIFMPAVEHEPSGFEWKYLWLIPATFYVVWYCAFYSVVSRTALEIALRPKNTLFILLINIGAFLIYYVVARLISEQNKTLELTEKNHRLTMQTVQYENLQEKITEARRAKHDVRHHIALMKEYLNKGDYAALKEYLDKYGMSLPDDSLIQFCQNTVANTVLLYFAQQAKNEHIDYIVNTDIPQSIAISDTDISVLLGNMIENALDACKAENKSDKKIIIRASCSSNSLCITVDNTFTGELKYDSEGKLMSAKHSGAGLGTQSIKSIAENYGGICRFEVKGGMFYASVFCSAKQRLN